jgi:signal transduction histidine kinase
MKLRAKVLLTTAAVMAVGFVIVTLAFVAQLLSTARVENSPAVKAKAIERFQLSVMNGSLTRAADGPKRVTQLLKDETGLAGRWAIVDARGTILAAEPADLCGRAHIDKAAVMLVSARDPGGDEYRLYAYTTLLDPKIAGHLAALVPAMLFAAVLLGAVLWLLLSRQVLTPVVELAEASRLMASGSAAARARGENRPDEIGELVRSFNRMAEEVAANRRGLEQRVAEETEKARRAEAAAHIAQRLAATGKLAAGVAHEINNPLGGMINAARRLESSIPAGDAKGREYLGLIHEGLERVARITKQMLRFQRPASTTAGPVDLSEALASALRFAEHRLKGAEVARELPAGLPAVLGVRQELEQVFLNLVLNAADAVRDAAAKRVTVRARAEDGGRRLAVEIEDNGCGMTPEELAAAFDIFHTTKSEGSGLGLPVAYSIVQSHGGELVLESVKGRGTKAIVRLPSSERKG